MNTKYPSIYLDLLPVKLILPAFCFQCASPIYPPLDLPLSIFLVLPKDILRKRKGERECVCECGRNSTSLLLPMWPPLTSWGGDQFALFTTEWWWASLGHLVTTWQWWALHSVLPGGCQGYPQFFLWSLAGGGHYDLTVFYWQHCLFLDLLLDRSVFHCGNFCLHLLVFLGYEFLQFRVWNISGKKKKQPENLSLCCVLDPGVPSQIISSPHLHVFWCLLFWEIQDF